MRLLKTDRLILETILKDGNTGLHVNNICKNMYKHKATHQRSNINKRLRFLLRNRVVKRIGDKQHQPILWQVNTNRTDIVWIKISCPKPECNTQRIASSDQMRVRCANPECLTPNGERTQYHVLEDRIDDYIPLILSSHSHSPLTTKTTKKIEESDPNIDDKK